MHNYLKAALLVGLSCCAYGCSKSDAALAATDAEPALVEATTAPTLERASTIKGIGRLMGAKEITLSFKAAGVITEVAVENGDLVRAGDSLARLDTVLLDADVARNGEVLAKARSEVERANELFASQLISRQQRDDAASAYRVAQVNMRTSQRGRQYGTIVAPVSGRVIGRMRNPGETVAPGQPVLSVSDEGGGWQMQIDLPDRDALRVVHGAPASIAFDALPGTFKGHVIRTGGMADAATGTLQVDVAMDAPDARLRPGLIGRVEIASSGFASGVALPSAALIDVNGNVGIVNTIVDKKIHRRSIVLGRVRGDYVEALQGLDSRDLIVVAGARNLSEGTVVRVANP